MESKAIAFHGGPITWFGDEAVSEMLVSQNFEGTRIMVVSDSNIAKTEHFMRFRNKLTRRVQSKTQLEFAILEPQEPSSQVLGAQLQSLRDLDVSNYVGYGGGSVMDSAKVFRAVKDSGHSLQELLSDPSQIKKKSQLILIPTTAGTGSEMSPIAVFEHCNEKVGFSSYELRADVVAIEPQLCATCPRDTVESSGIDAFSHALESTISSKANFVSTILSPASLRLVYAAFQKILQAQTPGGEGLISLCKGIMLSSVSYGYAGCCGIHGLAYPLSSNFHIRHGQAVALLLLPVLRYYFAKQPQLASAIRSAFDNQNLVSCHAKDDSEYVLGRISELLSLCSTLPTKLANLGVTTSDLPLLAKQSQKATILLGNSPVPIGESQALDIYTECLQSINR